MVLYKIHGLCRKRLIGRVINSYYKTENYEYSKVSLSVASVKPEIMRKKIFRRLFFKVLFFFFFFFFWGGGWGGVLPTDQDFWLLKECLKVALLYLHEIVYLEISLQASHYSFVIIIKL